jgi:2-polyprenyl-3-methyl-5-hydroxy-6-metoxy-1,4-benzoquinol methylase
MTDRDAYDAQYRATIVRYGDGATDIERRLDGLLWRHRYLLRAFPIAGKRILDHGCMDGVFTIALQRAGADVTGFDIAPAAITQAEKFRGAAAGPRFLLDPPTGETFDFVFSNEVIEHVPDDRAFAGELIKFVRPGGSLVGTTPVGRYFWDPDHKREYDEALLRSALEPWGRVTLKRLYRKAWRNLFPWPQRSASVWVFQVERPA